MQYSSFSFGKKQVKWRPTRLASPAPAFQAVLFVVVTLSMGCIETPDTQPSPEPVPVQQEECQGVQVDLDFVSDRPVRHFDDDVIVTLLDAVPKTPDRGDNTFTFSLANNDDTPYQHPGEILLSPFMPEHGHGSLPLDFPPLESSDFAAGELIFGPIDFFMLGRWDLHLRLLDDDGSEQDAIFTFCIEG